MGKKLSNKLRLSSTKITQNIQKMFPWGCQDSKRNSQIATKKACKKDGENNRTESKIDQDYLDISFL